MRFLLLLLPLASLSFSFVESPVTFPNYNGPEINASSGYAADLFFVHFDQPASSTLLVWIQGGPGCSGLFGLLAENGPLATDDGINVRYRESNWGSQIGVSSLYLEQPIGTGFSIASANYSVFSDLAAAQRNADFLEAFVSNHKRYERIFIAGESHGGLYVPLVVRELQLRNSFVFPRITHIALGNPRFSCTESPASPWQSNYVKTISFNILKYRGLVPALVSSQWDHFNCQVDSSSSKSCENLLNDLFSTLPLSSGYLSTDNFLFQKCVGAPSLNFPEKCGEMNSQQAVANYLNLPSVQKALHVKQMTVDWSLCNSTISNNWTFDAGSMIPILEDISIDWKIRLLIYNGDLDILEIPAVMTRFCLATSKRWVSVSQQEAWFVKPGVWAGMRECYTPGNVTWSSVHGAGHLAPQDQPQIVLELIKSFYNAA